MNPMVIRIAADLKEFRANMAEMKVQLETSASAMKRMASAFDGSKVIGDANAMVKSIGDIGGASKLTEAEMKRVNSTVTEALAKYKALGRDAPPELLKLRDATKAADAPMKQLGDSSTSLMGRVKGMAGMLGLAFGGAAVISGIKSLISNTFEYAETIKDTSDKMGVSLQATQRWKFAAEQTGASLENVSKSVLKLSQGLAGGDKGLKEALVAAGVQFDSLRAMKPEDAFNTVAAAIAKIPDPMLQSRLMLEAFGKSGLELLPAVREGFLKLADGAKTMSDETIRRLDDAKDKWSELGTQITIVSGEILVNAGEGFRKFFVFLSIMQTQGIGAAEQWRLAMIDAEKTTLQLTASQKLAAEALHKKGETVQQIAKYLVMGEKSVKAYIDTLKKAPPVLGDFGNRNDAAADAARRLAEAFQKNVDQWTSAAATQGLAAIRKEIDAAGGVSILTREKYHLLERKLSELVAQGGKTDAEFRAIVRTFDNLNTKIPVTTNAFANLKAMLRDMPSLKLEAPPVPVGLPIDSDPWGIIDSIERSMVLAGKNTRYKFPAMEAAKTWKDGFVEFMGQAASAIGSSIVSAIEGGGNVVLAALSSLASSAGQHFTSQFSKALKADGTREMSDAMAGILGAGVSSIVGIGMSIVNDMFKPVYTVLEQLAMASKKSVGEITDQLKQMGAAGVKAFEDMTRAGLSFDNYRNRRQGKDDAESLLGLLDQFQTKDELQKIADQWKAAYDFMLSSGQYTAAQLAEAWKRYQSAVEAARGAVEDVDSRPEGARGFPTRAQLQQAAADAKAVYDYMLASGLYTEDTLKEAWESWANAAEKAGDKTLASMRKIDKEMESLREAIAVETPEFDEMGNRIYGVVEAQQMERLRLLEEEKEAMLKAQAVQEQACIDASATATSEAKKQFDEAEKLAINFDDKLRRLFSNGYEIPITFRMPNGLPSGTSAPPTAPPPVLFGGLTPLPTARAAASGPIIVNVPVNLDGREIARNSIKLIPGELDLLGARG